MINISRYDKLIITNFLLKQMKALTISDIRKSNILKDKGLITSNKHENIRSWLKLRARSGELKLLNIGTKYKPVIAISDTEFNRYINNIFNQDGETQTAGTQES